MASPHIYNLQMRRLVKVEAVTTHVIRKQAFKNVIAIKEEL
jgi:hypothetical protein